MSYGKELGSQRESGKIKSHGTPRGARAEAKGHTFVCGLFLLSRRHDSLVTKAWPSCQAGSFQLPPENTSEVIPLKAQNPEIKRGSNSPGTGLARPKGCGCGHGRLALKQSGGEQNRFPKSWGEVGMDVRKPSGWKHISLPPLLLPFLAASPTTGSCASQSSSSPTGLQPTAPQGP